MNPFVGTWLLKSTASPLCCLCFAGLQSLTGARLVCKQRLMPLLANACRPTHSLSPPHSHKYSQVAAQEAEGRRVAIVKSSVDDRYARSWVVTHDGRRARCFTAGTLGEWRRHMGELLSRFHVSRLQPCAAGCCCIHLCCGMLLYAPVLLLAVACCCRCIQATASYSFAFVPNFG